jgi:hypothetical protein
MRQPRRRVRTALATTLCAATVALTTAAAPGPDPYAAPAATAPLTADGIDARYAAIRADIARALETARRTHDSDKVAAFTEFLYPGRQFLAFDPRGSGRVVEVLGDLAGAERIAVIVPGVDSTLGNFDSRKWAGGGARALAEEARRQAPGTRLAVVAWLGYASPKAVSMSVLTDGRAAEGGHELEEFVGELRRANPSAHTSLLCHSYGSVVCAKAADGPPVDDIALYGSPGTGANNVADLKTTARVWAARGSDDWIQLVPHARLFGIGFGPDPVSRGFGARIFDAGSVTHSDYLRPGTTALRNLALIALGRDAEVSYDQHS